MTDAELEEIIIHRWPALTRYAMVHGDDWTRKFARSIARNAKRPAWRPSPKQQFIMRRLLAEMGQDNLDVLE